jgi:hypothetical protein
MIREPVHRSVLTAQPGWAIIVPEDGDGEKLFRMPVIAWLCEVHLVAPEPSKSFVVVTPVTCTGSIGDFATYAFQFQDQPRFFTYNETFDDQAALFAFFRREEDQRRRSRRFGEHGRR